MFLLTTWQNQKQCTLHTVHCTAHMPMAAHWQNGYCSAMIQMHIQLIYTMHALNYAKYFRFISLAKEIYVKVRPRMQSRQLGKENWMHFCVVKNSCAFSFSVMEKFLNAIELKNAKHWRFVFSFSSGIWEKIWFFIFLLTKVFPSIYKFSLNFRWNSFRIERKNSEKKKWQQYSYNEVSSV